MTVGAFGAPRVAPAPAHLTRAESGAQLTDERLLAEIRRTVPLSRSLGEKMAALRRMARERFVLVE